MSGLPSQSTRRRDVVLLFASYPLGTWVLHQSLGESRWYVAAHLVLLGLVVGLLSFGRVIRAGRMIADDTDAALDERQLALRNAAYLDAYRIVSATAVLGVIWVAIGVDKGLWWTPRTYNEWNDVFWGLFILTTSLPAAFLSWREPDRAEDRDEAPADMTGVRAAMMVAFTVAASMGTSSPALAQVGAGSDVNTSAIASYDSAWSAISRTYWDTAFVASRWRAAHDSIRASLPAAANVDAVRGAIRALIAVPAQSHFVLLPASATPVAAGGGPSDALRPGTVGMDVRTIGTDVILSTVTPDGAAHRAGLRAGDRLTGIDTLPVSRMRAMLREAMPHDTLKADALLATFVKARLGGGVGDTLILTVVDRHGRARLHALVRTPLAGRLTQFGNLPPIVVTTHASRSSVRVRGEGKRSVAVIGWSAWFPALSPTLDTLFFTNRDAHALIIDLRGNPGGVIGMIAGVSGHLLDSIVSLGELRSRSGTLRFSANPRRVDQTGRRSAPFAGPVAIIVDEFSASTSEFFASGMQALGRARVFGTRSAGMALPAAMGRLPSGDVLMHVIADHSDARGRRVEGIGVQPDQATPLRVADLRVGRDAALEAARAWIAAGAP